jgi:hypothetical protein
MRVLRLVFCVTLFLAFAITSAAQQTSPQVDPQAVAVLQQSVKAMGGTVPSDSVAAGSVTTVDGSQTSQGTIRILTKGTAQTLVQMTMPDATRTTIYSNGQANDLTDSTVNVLPMELVVTSQAPEFPLPFIGALLNDPDTSFQYVGLETANGQSLYHVKAWDSFASNPNLQSLSTFSTRDIWIDSASGLPQRISYIRKPAHGAVAGAAVDVFYSNYQNFSATLYPSTVQKWINGVPRETTSIASVSLNTGLTDASFPIQAQ